MPLVVHTARLGECDRGDVLDVSRGTGYGETLALAPSRAILRPVQVARRRMRLAALGGRIVMARQIDDAAWDAYAPAYVAEMRMSYKTRRAVWNSLLARERVTLGCHCQHSTHCHRYLLVGMLTKLGAIYEGELTDE